MHSPQIPIHEHGCVHLSLGLPWALISHQHHSCGHVRGASVHNTHVSSTWPIQFLWRLVMGAQQNQRWITLEWIQAWSLRFHDIRSFTMYILYYYQATEKWALGEGWSWGQCTLFVLKLVAFKACYKTGACHVVPPWYLRNPFFVCAEIWDFEIKVDLCFSFACLIDQSRSLPFGQGFPLRVCCRFSDSSTYSVCMNLRGMVQCNSFRNYTKLTHSHIPLYLLSNLLLLYYFRPLF